MKKTFAELKLSKYPITNLLMIEVERQNSDETTIVYPIPSTLSDVGKLFFEIAQRLRALKEVKDDVMSEYIGVTALDELGRMRRDERNT